MLLFQAAVVVALLGLLAYGAIMVLTRAPAERPPEIGPVTWAVAHYDADRSTRIVVRKVSAGGTHVLDEHLVATVPVDDPDYDEKFLQAMTTARQRRALFETEAEPD